MSLCCLSAGQEVTSEPEPSPEPEQEPEGTPEPEPEGVPGLPELQTYSEPEPNWPEAKQKWGSLWEVSEDTWKFILFRTKRSILFVAYFKFFFNTSMQYASISRNLLVLSFFVIYKFRQALCVTSFLRRRSWNFYGANCVLWHTYCLHCVWVSLSFAAHQSYMNVHVIYVYFVFKLANK